MGKWANLIEVATAEERKAMRLPLMEGGKEGSLKLQV